jgi:hypothetical protein
VPSVLNTLSKNQNHWLKRKETFPWFVCGQLSLRVRNTPVQVPYPSSVPTALLWDPEKQRPEEIHTAASVAVTKTLSPKAHPGLSGRAAHSQVGKEIRPVSLATGRVGPAAG